MGTFILSMSEEEAAFFSGLLLRETDHVAITIANKDELAGAITHTGGRARLISFCSDLIIPAGAIEALGGECYNFHSGPPDQRGYRPPSFAAARRDKFFGVTFHRLIAEIDAGEIYATRRFTLGERMTESDLSSLTYAELLNLARDVAPSLRDFKTKMRPSGERWRGPLFTKADHQRLQQGRRG